jgi:hypothetical protein
VAVRLGGGGDAGQRSQLSSVHRSRGEQTRGPGSGGGNLRWPA